MTGQKGGISHAKSIVNGTKPSGKKRHSDDTKWCVYHKTKLHSTGECKVVLDQAAKMRSTWEANRAEQQPYRNKTWVRNSSCKPNNNASFSKQELHATVSEIFQQMTKKQKTKKNEIEDKFNVDEFINQQPSDDDSKE